MDSPSFGSDTAPSPSSVPAAMEGGGALRRTLAVGWHIAFRVWPVAALTAAPLLIMSLLGYDLTAGKLTWPRLAVYGFAASAHALIAASLLPSVMRWFADTREVTSFHGRDLRGRIRPALVAALASVLFPCLSGLFFRRQSPLGTALGGWLLLPLMTVFFVVVWIHLRLLLIVAVAVVERRGVLGAARRSWSLTRGKLLTILGVGFVLVVLWIVPVIAGALASSGSNSASHGSAWSTAVSQTLMMPWLIAFVAVLYHDARHLHDDVNSLRIAEDATSS